MSLEDSTSTNSNNEAVKRDQENFKQFIVDWKNEKDPDNPRNWSRTQKNILTIVTALDSFITSFASTTISPAMSDIAILFGFAKNETLAALCVSVFVLPWAFVPLVGSPLSEIYGRKRPMLICIWGLFFFNMGCTWCQTKEQLIVCRFFAGFFSASSLSIGPGALGDAFDNEHRNNAIALYAVALVFGPVLSPIISGFVVQNVGWRWVFKILLILNAVIILINHIILKESYPPTILNYKKQRLQKEDLANSEKYQTIFDIADNENRMSNWKFLKLNMVRPLVLLFCHPMVYGLGAYLAFINGLLYLMIVIFPTTWELYYGFSVSISGLMFITMGIGFLIGIACWTFLIDRGIDNAIKNLKEGEEFKPEIKLRLLIFGGVLGPAGMLAFGWTVEKHVHWIAPSIFAALFAFATVNVFQTINNYLIDMNPRYSASSVAAATVYRSLFGFTFPLFAPKFYEALGFGKGNTIFFCVGFALGIPYPLYAYLKGERLRIYGNNKVAKVMKRFE